MAFEEIAGPQVMGIVQGITNVVIIIFWTLVLAGVITLIWKYWWKRRLYGVTRASFKETGGGSVKLVVDQVEYDPKKEGYNNKYDEFTPRFQSSLGIGDDTSVVEYFRGYGDVMPMRVKPPLRSLLGRKIGIREYLRTGKRLVLLEADGAKDAREVGVSYSGSDAQGEYVESFTIIAGEHSSVVFRHTDPATLTPVLDPGITTIYQRLLEDNAEMTSVADWWTRNSDKVFMSMTIMVVAIFMIQNLKLYGVLEEGIKVSVEGWLKTLPAVGSTPPPSLPPAPPGVFPGG